MIEIKISIDAALNLLLERMKFEMKKRKKIGLIEPGLRLENLSYKDLVDLLETSIFDTVFLLPVELVVAESNLPQIIYETIQTLSKALFREELLLFPKQRVAALLKPIVDYFKEAGKDQIIPLN
jgi:hypothetical protein